MTASLARLLHSYRDAYTGHSPQIWVLAIFSFINRVGTMVVLFLTVYLTTVLHFPLQKAGMIAAVFGLGSLTGAWIGGRLTDRFGGLPVILGSLFSSGILLILLQFPVAWEWLAVCVFFTALIGDAYRPAVMTMVGEFSGGNPGRSTALIRLAINVGFGLAPAIGGWMVKGFGYPVLFWADGLTCIAAALYLMVVARRWPQARHSRTVRESRQVARANVLPPWRNPRYLLFLAASFGTSFGFMQWFNSVPVFLKTNWLLEEQYIGSVIGINGLLIVLAEMPLVHALEHGKRGRVAMLSGILFTALSFSLFLLPGSLWVAVGAVLVMTVGEMLYQPFQSSLALQLSPEARRGEYMAWYSMSWGVANIAAPAIGLAVADTLGFPVLWGIVAAFAALSLLLSLRFDPDQE